MGLPLEQGHQRDHPKSRIGRRKSKQVALGDDICSDRTEADSAREQAPLDEQCKTSRLRQER